MMEALNEHAARPLKLADGVVFTCQSCGDCCRGAWLIGVDDAAHAALNDVDWPALDPRLGQGEKFTPLAQPLPSGERMTFARAASGACVFLTDANRCGIQERLGHGAKPQVCREFPYQLVETPDGITAGLSFACTAVLHHRGAPLADQRAEVAAVVAGSARVAQVPDPIVLYSGVDIAWPQYRVIEDALLAVLARETIPFPAALLTGSLLVALAVSLVRLEQRRGGTAGPTLAGAFDELAGDGYRRLVDVAVGTRAPARASLTHLAPLYTWLAFSREPGSRLGLVLALYRNYFRFRRGAGRLPDPVTGGAAVELADLARIRFTTDGETSAFLREYWRHVVARKTLTPMHGVFRGYHTMLTLYAFMKWIAKAIAHRDGRAATGIDDVRAAVRLVEQRFVLHAQFAQIFELSPVMTMLADRLYRERGFVPRVVLEPADPVA